MTATRIHARTLRVLRTIPRSGSRTRAPCPISKACSMAPVDVALRLLNRGRDIVAQREPAAIADANAHPVPCTSAQAATGRRELGEHARHEEQVDGFGPVQVPALDDDGRRPKVENPLGRLARVLERVDRDARRARPPRPHSASRRPPAAAGASSSIETASGVSRVRPLRGRGHDGIDDQRSAGCSAADRVRDHASTISAVASIRSSPRRWSTSCGTRSICDRTMSAGSAKHLDDARRALRRDRRDRADAPYTPSAANVFRSA